MNQITNNDMKKMFTILAIIALFGAVSCTKDETPIKAKAEQEQTQKADTSKLRKGINVIKIDNEQR